ncbi:hypothetical protein ANN_19545 [Periplaneta americana]|uniref:Uncharacterized protein n=1 Tax=Periplaneta americana TaxID=6978 RepID=A0ABQ8SAH7_PERAM|nr:hypothetical protein ANN_19545 [Periplaneta americana]
MLGENPQTMRENTGILLEASKAICLEVNPEKTKYMIMSRGQNIVPNGNIKIGDLSFEEVEKLKYLGATVTNINDMREEIKHRINMGNACYYSVEELSSSSLLSKNLKVRIYKTVILQVALYGCETWTVTSREKQRLRVFDNKVLRKIFGLRRMKLQENGESYTTQNCTHYEATVIIAGSGGKNLLLDCYVYLRKRNVAENKIYWNCNKQAFQRSPCKSVRRASRELAIPKSTIHDVLHKRLRLHAYKIQLVQKLKPNDLPARYDFASDMLLKIDIENGYLQKVVFSDESTFHVCGIVNRHNCRIWGSENPHVVRELERDSPKINVWCGLTHEIVIGPLFFVENTMNGNVYLDMLQNYAIPQIPQEYVFQQDGAPPHYALHVTDHLNECFLQ